MVSTGLTAPPERSAQTRPAPPVPERRAARGLRIAALVAIGAVPALVLLVLFFYPVGAMMARGLWQNGGFDLTGFGQTLGRARFRRILWFTVWQAAASAGLCLVLGLPGAYLLYRKRFRGQAMARAALTVPFVLPTVVVGLAFRTLFAENGPLGSWGWDGSVPAILAAHVCLNYAVVVRTVGIAWAGLDSRPEEAARSLGASPLRVLMTVTLPALGPAIAGAAVMVFLFCATSFGVMMVMGGGKYSTLETEIYRQTVDLLDLPTAAVVSIVQILLVTTTLLAAAWLRRRTERIARGVPHPAARLRLSDLPAVLVTAVSGLVIFGPLVVMAVRSLQTPDGWGLANYRNLSQVGADNIALVPATTALWNSVRTAMIAAAVAVALGVLLSVVLARRPRSRGAARLLGAFDTVLMLPLGVSAVTVGFGFLIALDRPPLDLRSSALLVPLAQALVATPLVVRMVLPVLRSADGRLREAAAMLGAPPVRVWASVDLPLMGRALAGASAFALAVALGEFGATSFLARPTTVTLPVLIDRLISRPGPLNTGTALAAATVLALCCVLVVMVVDAVAGDRRTGIGV